MSEIATDELNTAAAEFTAECRYTWSARYKDARKAAMEAPETDDAAQYLESAFSWGCALTVFCGICRKRGLLRRDLIEIMRATSGIMTRLAIDAREKNIWNVPEFPRIPGIDDEAETE